MPGVTVRVRSVLKATSRTRIVKLDLNGAAFQYRAGQGVMVGAHGQPLKRPYSIAIAPQQAADHDAIELLLKVDENGSPGAHLPRLARGVLVDLEGPYGSFCFPDQPAENRFVFIAGGTGIAPLRAMLWHALLTNTAGQISVMYTARAPDDFPYLRELRRLERKSCLTLHLTVTRESGDRWRGYRGRIDGDKLAAIVKDGTTLCFICGPPSLLEEVRPILRQLGVEPARIRTEEW